jgi:hypothetical protein
MTILQPIGLYKPRELFLKVTRFDGKQASDSITLNADILPAMQIPMILEPDSVSTNEDTPSDIFVYINDTNPELNQLLFVNVSALTGYITLASTCGLPNKNDSVFSALSVYANLARDQIHT